MKRKIALLLAVVMTLSLLPMNVFAASTNRADKTVTVVKNEILGRNNAPKLTIKPLDGYTTEQSIRLELTNAEWAVKEDYYGRVGTDTTIDPNQTITAMSSSWLDYVAHKADNMSLLDYTNSTPMGRAAQNDSELIWYWSISPGNPKVAVVTLAPVTSSLLSKNANTTDNGAKDCLYTIPLNVEATAEDDIKITINEGDSLISAGTYTFAKGVSKKGSTVTTVSDIEVQRDNVTIKPLAIRETLKNTITSNTRVRLRLSGNFEFKPGQEVWVSSDYKIDPPVQVYPAANATLKGDELVFYWPAGIPTQDRLDTFYVASTDDMDKGLVIIPIDEDEDWGDIRLTIDGTDVTKETIKVGERKDFGFSFKAETEAPTILAGRVFGIGADLGALTSDTWEGGSDVDEDDTETAEVFFAETIASTWLTTRKLNFTVPEGIKIADWEFDDEDYINLNYATVALSKNGRVLSIIQDTSQPNMITAGECAEFTLKLWLSAELGYEGDVPLSVSGGGIGANNESESLSDIVVAKVIAPISIEASTTSINLGYQNLTSSDIKITEAVAGTFIKDNRVYVSIDSIYATSDLGFADENITYEIDGELAITGFKVEKGYIRFDIDRTSKDAPSSITIKNVKIGTNRSVAYGGYDLLVNGNAFINNYRDPARDYLPEFDENEGYKFKDYIRVVTETGTLDKVVKVTIGEKTALIDEVAVDIDVAAYIQASSASTMVPLRFVSLALGVDDVTSMDESSKLSWDANTKTVTIFYGAGTNMTTIKFVAGSDKMTINGAEVPMVGSNGSPVKAEITDSRMFVPFRALGTAFGVNVSWDDATRTAIYNQK